MTERRFQFFLLSGRMGDSALHVSKTEERPASQGGLHQNKSQPLALCLRLSLFPQMEGKRGERHRRQVQPEGEGEPGGAGWKMEVVVKPLSSSLWSAAIHPQAPFSTEM